MPEIPEELIQQIIEHLWNDNLALRSASCAASIFRTSCQKALFSELVLSYPSADACRRLLEIFQQSPIILSYIKGISVLAKYQPGHSMVLPDEICDVLSFIPLDNVQRYSCAMSYPSWSFASNAIKKAGLAPSLGPSLRSLRLRCVPLPIEIRSPFLKDLSVLFCRWPDTDESLPKVVSSVVQLKSLEVSQDIIHVGFFEEGFTDLNLNHLKSLTFQSTLLGRDINQPLDIRPLLIACASSLETFTFHADYGIYIDRHLPYIAKLAALRKLVIRQRGEFKEPPIILNNLPSPNFIGTIQIELLFADPDPVDALGDDKDLWTEVDELLSNQQRFPNLHDVVIKCSSEYEFEPDEPDEWFEVLRERLPKLMQKGILNISLDTSADDH